MPGPAGLDPHDILELRQLREIDDLNGLLEIMAFLYRYESGTISNFIKDLRLNQQPVYRTLKRLEQLDLVETDRESRTRKEATAPIYYRLTARGKKLGKPFNDLATAYARRNGS